MTIHQNDIAAVKDEAFAGLKEDMARLGTNVKQAIYIVAIVQYFAIIGSVFLLMKYGH